MHGKEVIVYFANWYLDKKTAREGAEICSIPWDKVSYVNHAFWYVEPADGTTETSFQRRDAGLPPRTSFRLTSLTPSADLGDPGKSEIQEGLSKNHFQQYAYYAEKYPDVKILISIGGWTRCGWFSEMAYTQEGRDSFVNCCMELLKTYPWLGGFDIDWEYFGGNPNGERVSGEPDDQGCPIWGTSLEDCENLSKLSKQLKETMDSVYGKGVKKLTACSCGSTWTLSCQRWDLVAPYMDMINIMSYDMAGVWDRKTDHASEVFQSQAAADYIHNTYGVPYEKLCIGSPLYGTEMQMENLPQDGNYLGVPVYPVRPASAGITETVLKQWEAEAVSGYTVEFENGKAKMGTSFCKGGKGWHMGFDESRRGAYLYNDDPDSKYCCWFISYENAITLQDKLDLILKLNCAGMLVWEVSQDTLDHRMIGQMAENLF